MILKTPASGHTIVADDAVVRIPSWVVDLASFRRWYHSDDFPDEGRICYLQDGVWVDMSKEQLFSHNKVKTEFSRCLATLVKEARLGHYFSDGARLSHPATDLSCVPDGTFFTAQALQSGRIALVSGAREGYVELEGTPDMVLEIVSPGSEQKDTAWLRQAYWKAGIAEYWLVDVRGDRFVFDILRHRPKGYALTRKQAGWVRSRVFAKAFRLTREVGPTGLPEYTLEVR